MLRHLILLPKDLIELLDLSNKNLLSENFDSWHKVLPLYPISPTN